MKTTTTILTLIFIFYATGYAQTSQKFLSDEIKFVNLQGHMVEPTEEPINKNKKENFLFYSNTPENIKYETSSSGTSLFDSTISQNYDATSKNWINSYKITYSFDDYGNDILSTYCRWNVSTGQWIPVSKEKETFNTSGKVILLLNSIWEESDSLWINESKTETKWDPNMEWEQSYGFKWDRTIGRWDSSSRTIINYDHNGNISSYLTYKRDQNGNKWIEHFKEEYNYDSSGNNIERFSFSWNVNTSQWDTTYKLIMAFDSDGRKTLQMGYQMDYPGMVTFAYRFEYTYDHKGNLIQQLIMYDISKESNQWRYEKNVMTRDDNGNAIHSATYSFDKTNDKWILLSYMVSEFDAFGNQAQQVSYNIHGNDTVPSTKSFWYYSYLPTSDNYEHNQENALRLFPNPSNGYFHLINDNPELESTLMLYDLQGRLIINQKVNSTTPVSTEKLQKGMYIYRISENGNIFTGKLIVR